MDFENSKSQIAILVLNQCSISAVFPIVRFAGDQKTALTGESLYDKKVATPKATQQQVGAEAKIINP